MTGNATRRVLVLLLAATWAVPAPAQEPAESAPPGLTREVAGVNRSLARVAVLLEQLLEHQKTDLLLKRIEIRERRLAPVEGELRQTEGDLQASRAELERLENLKRDWRDRLTEAARTDEAAAIELREMQSQFEDAFAHQTARHRGLEERVRKLEDDLAEGREQLRDLEALLLERLGG